MKNSNMRNRLQSVKNHTPAHENNYIGKKSLGLQVEVDRMLFRKSLQIGIIALLLLTSMMVIMIPRPAEAGFLTFVQTSVTADSSSVDVAPGAEGRITFSGRVTATNYNTATPLIVNLFATSTIGVATMDKPQIVFQGAYQEDNFQVSVLVPIITTVRQPAQLSVSGTWQQGGTSGQAGGGQADFLVGQFQLVTVYSEMPVIETGPGTNAVFSLRIENTGNYRDEYRIEVSNRDDLSEKGYIIPDLPKTWIELGEPKIFTLPATLPHDWTIWTDHPETIWIKVTSISSGEAIYEEYPLIIRVRGIYIPGFEPVFAIMCIAFLAVALKRRQKKKH
jgi:hypothetical protein